MAHIIINQSLSAAIGYKFFNPAKFAEVSVILEPANSTRKDYIEYRDRETVYKLRHFYSVEQDYIKCRYLFCILIASYRHGET